MAAFWFTLAVFITQMPCHASGTFPVFISWCCDAHWKNHTAQCKGISVHDDMDLNLTKKKSFVHGVHAKVRKSKISCSKHISTPRTQHVNAMKSIHEETRPHSVSRKGGWRWACDELFFFSKVNTNLDVWVTYLFSRVIPDNCIPILELENPK